MSTPKSGAAGAPHVYPPFGLPYAYVRFDEANRCYSECPVCGERCYGSRRADPDGRRAYQRHFVAAAGPRA